MTKVISSFSLSPTAKDNLDEVKNHLGLSKSSYVEWAINEQSFKYRALGLFSEDPKAILELVHLLDENRKILLGKTKSSEWHKNFVQMFDMLGRIGVRDKETAERFLEFLQNVSEGADELRAIYTERWELED